MVKHATLTAEQLETWFVWFLRTLAVVFLTLGIWQWLVILDVGNSGEFLDKELSEQTAIGFFAAIDLVAAVGLWLTSSWGTVVWLLAALSDIVFHGFFPELAVTPQPIIIFHATTMLCYLWLAINLARQHVA